MPPGPDHPTPPGNDDSGRPPDARAGAIDVIAHVESVLKQGGDDERTTALQELREAALRAAGVLPHPAIPREQLPRLGLRRSDQLVVGVLLAVATGLMTVYWVGISDWGRRPIEIDRLPRAAYQYRIDINRATWVEWAQLEGIGETLARRIVEDRERRGPFSSVDDLLRVRGIGPVKLDAMREHLKVANEARTGEENASALVVPNKSSGTTVSERGASAP